MRKYAVIIEGYNYSLLFFIHNVVHNFVKQETSMYVEAVRDRIYATSKEEAKIKEKEIEKYSKLRDESSCKPTESFFTEGNRIALQKNKELKDDFDKLVEVTNDFYKFWDEEFSGIITETIHQCDLGFYIKPKFRSSIKSLENIIKEKDSRKLLKMFPEIKRQLLDHTRNYVWDLDLQANIIKLDIKFTELYKKELSLYADKISKKLYKQTITKKDINKFLSIYAWFLEVWRMENEIFWFDKCSTILNNLDILTDLDIHNFGLTYAYDKAEQWRISRLYRDEVIEHKSWFLNRDKETETERIINYHKKSALFTFEHIDPILIKILNYAEDKSFFDLNMNDIKKYYNKTISSKATEQRINELQKNQPKEKNNLPERSNYLTTIEHSPDVESAKLLEFFEPAYKKRKNNKDIIKVKINSRNIEYIPFVINWLDGIIMKEDGKIVKNPTKRIKEIYSIPNFMYKNLRYSGD